MAFTQDRAIALIDAANDYRNAFNTLIDHINAQFQQAQQSQNWQAFAYSVANYAAPDQLLSSPTQSNLILARETDHFIRNKARNEAARARMQRNRPITPRRPYHQILSTTNAKIRPPISSSHSSQSSSPQPEICPFCQAPLSDLECGFTANQAEACTQGKPLRNTTDPFQEEEQRNE